MGADGILVTPQVVVAVVVAFVITNVLPAPGPKTPETLPSHATLAITLGG